MESLGSMGNDLGIQMTRKVYISETLHSDFIVKNTSEGRNNPLQFATSLKCLYSFMLYSRTKLYEKLAGYNGWSELIQGCNGWIFTQDESVSSLS